MSTKNQSVVAEQGFKNLYVATQWAGDSDVEIFYDCSYYAGETAEEAANRFQEHEGEIPKYVYVISTQLKAVTTYK